MHPPTKPKPTARTHTRNRSPDSADSTQPDSTQPDSTQPDSTQPDSNAAERSPSSRPVDAERHGALTAIWGIDSTQPDSTQPIQLSPIQLSRFNSARFNSARFKLSLIQPSSRSGWSSPRKLKGRWETKAEW